MSAPTLAVVVLTWNEEDNIRECLESLSWAERRVVFDSGSEDDTVRLAREMGAEVLTRPFDNYAAQRNAALERVEADWIFFVDADERATPILAKEIQNVIHDPGHAGWWVPRENYIVGRRVRGAGWWPDYQLRLLRREKARYDPDRPVHEVVILNGRSGYLRHPLIHYNYRSWDQFHAKQRRYATYEAEALRRRGVRPRPHNFVLQPWREFRRRFFTLKGYRDGWWGLRLSLLLAYYYGFLPYVEMMRLREREGNGGDASP
ncbi:MAG: glycosyltransferase family 2 protein [Chloroflexi bacterium]|nr:glycosyltransferase family 2 protein [Chloroflexota bacterium]